MPQVPVKTEPRPFLAVEGSVIPTYDGALPQPVIIETIDGQNILTLINNLLDRVSELEGIEAS